VRYYGVRAGWWSTMLPLKAVSTKAHAMFIHGLAMFKK
jgi:hypothetical protein